MGFGNTQIMDRMKASANTPVRKPIEQKLLGTQRDGMRSRDVLAISLQATRDSYARSHVAASALAERSEALRMAATAAMEQPYQLADAPAGSDKTMHFFMSGYVASRTDEALASVHVPRALREPVATGASFAVGVLKEIADTFTSSGFSREDLKADLAGARSPFQHAG